MKHTKTSVVNILVIPCLVIGTAGRLSYRKGKKRR